MQPTMSKSGLLFECQWWAGPNVPKSNATVGLPARYGSAFHLVLGNALIARSITAPKFNVKRACEAACRKFNVPDPESLQEHVVDAFKRLMKWLKGENEYGVDFSKETWHVEVSFALKFSTPGEPPTARVCASPTEDTHDYPDVEKGELPGTADLVIVFKHKKHRWVLVLDHKTGESIELPGENAQLKSLALAACLHYEADGAILAVHHATSNGISTVYAEEIKLRDVGEDPDDLIEHGKVLAEALENVDSGYLRPGPWCTYCSAFTQCPTQSAMMVSLSGQKKLVVDSPEQMGRIFVGLRQYDQLRDELREMMRKWVEEHGEFECDEGLVGIEEHEQDNLSKASIFRALGKAEGNRLIEKLRKMKCIETRKVRQLRVLPG